MPDIDFGTVIAIVMAIGSAAGVWAKLSATISKVCSDLSNLKETLASQTRSHASSLEKFVTAQEKLWVERDKLHDATVELKADVRRILNGEK